MPLLVALGREVETWPSYMSNLVFENWRKADGQRYVKVGVGCELRTRSVLNPIAGSSFCDHLSLSLDHLLCLGLVQRRTVEPNRAVWSGELLVGAVPKGCARPSPTEQGRIRRRVHSASKAHRACWGDSRDYPAFC